MKNCNVTTLKGLSALTAAVAGMILSASSLATPGKPAGKEEATSFSTAPAALMPKGGIEPSGGIAASCGTAEITQNVPDATTIGTGTVSCNGGAPTFIPVDNFYARSYQIASDVNINCVDFAVQSNNAVGPWPVRVRLYGDTNGGAPNNANLVQIGPDVNVTIPVSVTAQFFTATFPTPVFIPGGTTLVVELFQASRAVAAGGDGGSLFLGSNSLGQTGPTYIKAPGCAINDYVTTASINFPNVMILQRIGTTIAGDPCQLPLPSCAADVAPVGGNLIVDIDDLLAVINTWGASGPPRPQGDCAPLPNGNCLVNIDDLLAVIGAWGPCPAPTGACCLPTGSCLNAQTAAQCVTAGGNYQGNNTNCANITCPVLNNDNCSDAKALTVGGAAVCEDLSTATLDTVVSCNGINAGLGRWYTVIGNGKNYKADLCSGPNVTSDLILSVYCGNTCADLTCVDAQNVDSCGFTGEQVTWCTANGQKYWILVHVPNVSGSANYCVKVTDLGTTCTTSLVCGTPPPPANDECAGATTVTCGSTNTVTAAQYASYTFNAADPVTACELAGGGPFTHDASWWYSITTGAAQTSLKLSMCTTNGATTGDVVLGLYSGACGALTEVACDDDTCVASPAFGPSVLCATVTPNTTYKILVNHYSPADPGNYVLVVDCVTPCTPPPGCAVCTGTPEGQPCRVDGDDPALDPNGGCNSVPPAFGFAVTVGQSVCGIASTYTTGTATSRDTDWYTFTPTTTGNYTIQWCSEFIGATGFITNSTPDVTTCGALVAAGGAFNGAIPALTPTNVTTTTNLTAGTKYAVFCSSSQGQTVSCATNNKYQFKIVTAP